MNYNLHGLLESMSSPVAVDWKDFAAEMNADEELKKRGFHQFGGLTIPSRHFGWSGRYDDSLARLGDFDPETPQGKIQVAERYSDITNTRFARHYRLDMNDLFNTPVEYRSRAIALRLQQAFGRELHGQDFNATRNQRHIADMPLCEAPSVVVGDGVEVRKWHDERHFYFTVHYGLL